MELRDKGVGSCDRVDKVGDRRLIIQNTPVRVIQIVNTEITDDTGSGITDKRLVFAQGCKLYHQLISQAVGEAEKTGAHALQELQIFPAHCSITEFTTSVAIEEDCFNLLVISNFTGKVLQLRSLDWTIVKSSPAFQLGSNWIKSAVWTSVSGGIRSSEFVTLTAKNELISWRWDWSNQKLVRCGQGVEYKVPEIYTGRLYLMGEVSNCDNRLESVLVCSGTVFGAVHLWNVVNGAVNLICTLEDHQGPITCIQLNLKQSYLITTSDDRCVKLYRIIDKTKFRGAGDGFQQLQNISIHLHLELFGHTARVYQGLVATNDVDRCQFVISSSNDGTVCIWGRLAKGQRQDNDKDDKDDGAMEIIRRWSSNNGSPVRALAYDPELDLLYTGGDDGSVMKWGVEFQGRSGIDSGQDFQLQLPVDWNCPRIVALANPNFVFGASHSQELRSFNIGIDPESEGEGSHSGIVWKSPMAGCKYTVMVLNSCKNLVAIGCSTGLVVIGKLTLMNLRQPLLEENSILQLNMNGTISNIVWISKNALIVSTRLGIYYVQLEEDNDRSIKILKTEEIPIQQMQQHSPSKSTTIPKITAAVQVPTDLFNLLLESLTTSLDSLTCLVLGDEHGVLRIYTRSTNLLLNDTAKWNLKLELPKWHAKYGISNLRFWNGRIVSTGRDCYLKLFTISACQDPELRIEVKDLHTIRTPFEWIDSTYAFKPEDHVDDLLCAGFHETQFQLYSIKTRSILAEIECGGAHRSYDWMLEPYNTVNGGHDFLLTLAFIRSKQINYTRAQVYDWLHPVKSGLPNISKKINCGAILEFGHGNGSNSNCTYFACGGEDTLISIFGYTRVKSQDNRPQLEFIEDLCGHSSSVRAVKYVPAGDSTGFLFSGGGRSELIAWKVKLVGKESQIRYERLQLLTLETGGVGDGDFGHFGSVKHEDRNDVRILDIQCHPVTNSTATATNSDGNSCTCILVFAACSDGSVHSLKFNDSVVKEGIKIKNCRPLQPYKVFLQQQSIFHALTRLFLSRNSSISGNSPQQLDVYGLTTNGYIYCWRTGTTEEFHEQDSNGSGQDFKQKPTATMSPADWSLQLTSSPVTSICVIPVSKNFQVEAMQVLIGCDDGTLYLYNFQTPTTDPSCATLIQRISAGIHTSTVSEIVLQEDDRGRRIITASVDQVVAVWELKYQDSFNSNPLTCISEFRTGVHDCQALILVKAGQLEENVPGENQLICCGGDGIEVGEFPPSL